MQPMFSDKTLSAEIESNLSSFLKKDIHIRRIEPVYGGDINICYRLSSNTGDFFLKTNEHPPDTTLFEKEYKGLAALKSANAIRVPEPLLYGRSQSTYFLVTEFMQKGKPIPAFWEDFARSVAGLHQCSGEDFGWEEDNFIGSLPQSNRRHQSWSEFYTAERLVPLVRMAYNKALLSRTELSLFDQLYRMLPQLLPEEKPSLLHGDLWGGNFLVASGGHACIYDPAIYYGHREADLAMARLFGGFDQKFFVHYNEYFPLPDGWKKRIPLYQLYYLLVHLVLFGRRYLPAIKEILEGY